MNWLKRGDEIKQKPLGGAIERIDINKSVSPSYRVMMSSLDKQGRTFDTRRGTFSKKSNTKEMLTRDEYK